MLQRIVVTWQGTNALASKQYQDEIAAKAASDVSAARAARRSLLESRVCSVQLFPVSSQLGSRMADVCGPGLWQAGRRRTSADRLWFVAVDIAMIEPVVAMVDTVPCHQHIV